MLFYSPLEISDNHKVSVSTDKYLLRIEMILVFIESVKGGSTVLQLCVVKNEF